MISIIIPALNEEEKIGLCLLSLINQSINRDLYEIIVVDGHSTDRTVKIASGFADKVIYQRSPGIGGARMDGVNVSKGEILVFTDSDTMHDMNWLESVQRNMICHEASTGPILFYDGNIRSDILTIWRKGYHLLHLFNFYWLIGSNMAIKKDTYYKINGHSNISILDDFDISVKLFREGIVEVRYDKDQIVYTSSRRINNLMQYMLVFGYGHYHYHLTKNYDNLLNYPRFDKMDLGTVLNISERLDRFGNIEKFNSVYSNLRSRLSRENQ
ncbi:MAG: glycosyltransferase [Halobacteriota archaeon]|nr:glycosyltransferase [Halobacteriota archaeon]